MITIKNTYKKIINEGLMIEVTHHSDHGKEKIWCYYLLIDKSKYKNYWNDFSDILEPDKGWENIKFHYGITWKTIQKTYIYAYDFKKNKKYIKPITHLKIGCDYHHLWDEGIHYTLDDVMSDAEKTTHQFMEQYPLQEGKNA